MSANVKKKIELPLVTVKRNQLWQEVESLYSGAYNTLTLSIGSIAKYIELSKQPNLKIDLMVITNMVSGLNRDTTQLRKEINDIYAKIQVKKSQLTDLANINMESIQITELIRSWMERHARLVDSQLHDLHEYVLNQSNQANVKEN
jgi:hypothetical protein